jgi:hypothetical protein
MSQLNREPSLDHLAFQIARTTISPNYRGEELETLIARSWSSLQMYHLKLERQMNNARSARTPTQPELFDDNKSLPLLFQVQVNN